MDDRVTLGSLAVKRGLVGGPFGSKLGKKDYVPAGVPVIRGENLDRGRYVSLDDCVYVTAEKVKMDLAGNVAIPGDLLFTQRGTLGQVATMPEGAPPSVISQSQMRLRVDEEAADPTYIYYWATSDDCLRQIDDRAIVSGVPHINLGILRDLSVPLVPLEEQRRIAGVLGAFDDLIDTNRRTVSQLRHLRWAVVENVVGDGELTELGTVANLVRDTVSPDIVAPETPYLGLEHFAVDGAGVVSVGRAEGLDSLKSRFQAQDVLYGKLRPYFRKVDRPAYSGICSTEIWVVRAKSPEMQHVVEWAVSSAEFTTYAMSASEGTRMPRANWRHCSQFRVPTSSQGRLRALNETVQPMFDLEWELRAEADHLASVRDELLPLLMSGRITVDEAWEAVS